MTKIKNTNFFIILAVGFSLIFGILIRSYNINYEDFWFDEILSFWIADPYISIGESLTRHNSIEQIPFFYYLLLKFIYGIFGYETHVGRYLSLFFSILGMLSIVYLSLIVKKNNLNIDFMNNEDFINSNANKIWLICLPDVMISKCNQPGKEFNVNILKEISFVGINLRLVNKI